MHIDEERFMVKFRGQRSHLKVPGGYRGLNSNLVNRSAAVEADYSDARLPSNLADPFSSTLTKRGFMDSQR